MSITQKIVNRINSSVFNLSDKYFAIIKITFIPNSTHKNPKDISGANRTFTKASFEYMLYLIILSMTQRK